MKMRWKEKIYMNLKEIMLTWFMAATELFIYFLKFPSFLKAGHIKGQDGTLCQIWNSEENTYWTVKLLSVILKYNGKQIFPEITPPYVVL